MSGHTPGPWVLTERKNYRRHINARGWNKLAKVVTRMEGDETESSEGLANARLIAAAPDLLEACQALSEYINGMADYVSGDTMVSVDVIDLRRALAAIAKATGAA